MNKRYGNLMMALAFVVLGTVMFVSSFQMKSLAKANIGPELVPRIIAVSLIGLGLLHTSEEFRRLKTAEQMQSMPEAAETQHEQKPFRQKYGFWLTIGLIFLYIWGISVLGFLLATIVYLFFQICTFAYDLRRQKLVQYALISFITAIVVYVLFVKVFRISLPAGILG